MINVFVMQYNWPQRQSNVITACISDQGCVKGGRNGGGTQEDKGPCIAEPQPGGLLPRCGGTGHSVRSNMRQKDVLHSRGRGGWNWLRWAKLVVQLWSCQGRAGQGGGDWSKRNGCHLEVCPLALDIDMVQPCFCKLSILGMYLASAAEHQC